jgi:Trk K+ transport system NAD-binding subunit
VEGAVGAVGAVDGAAPTILVAGADPLGLAVVERLVQSGASVTMLAEPTDASRHGHEIERIGARLVVGSARSSGELLAAGLEKAHALVLTANDDPENVDAALTARRLRPDLPLIVRLFDPTLGDYLRGTLDAVTILSTSAVAAPVIADMTLDALSRRSIQPTASRSPRARRRGKPRIDRVLIMTALAAIGLVAASTIYFSQALNLRPMDALYFVWTTIFTVGYGDISLREASDSAKIGGMGLMLTGAALVAIFYALLAGWVVGRRLDVLRGRVPVRGTGHIIVVGAGNVGFRVARTLAEKGRRVVVVERDGESRHVGDLRSVGHHVIVADAVSDETLDLAGLETAAALLALTELDATNLRIALAVRTRGTDIPVIVRLASQELSTHIADQRDMLPASSVAIAGEAFAGAALAAARAQ